MILISQASFPITFNLSSTHAYRPRSFLVRRGRKESLSNSSFNRVRSIFRCIKASSKGVYISECRPIEYSVANGGREGVIEEDAESRWNEGVGWEEGRNESCWYGWKEWGLRLPSSSCRGRSSRHGAHFSADGGRAVSAPSSPPPPSPPRSPPSSFSS